MSEESSLHEFNKTADMADIVPEAKPKVIRRGRPKKKIVEEEEPSDEVQAELKLATSPTYASLPQHSEVEEKQMLMVVPSPEPEVKSEITEIQSQVPSQEPKDRPQHQERHDRQEKPHQTFHKRPDFKPKFQHQASAHHQPKHPHSQQHQKKHGLHPQQSKHPQQHAQQHPKKVPLSNKGAQLNGLVLGNLRNFDLFRNQEALDALINEISENQEPVNFNELYELPLQALAARMSQMGIEHDRVPNRYAFLKKICLWAKENKHPIIVKGIVEILDNDAFVVYQNDNYSIRELSAYIPKNFVKDYGLLKGHSVEVQVHPPRDGETCPFVLKINKIMDMPPEEIAKLVPFEDLTPYYPTERLFLEASKEVEWDNFSMRVIDILTPIGLGQRGLIVAPPRTGKTMLLQAIAHAIVNNRPDAHLIVLLIDERPEEVTDFKRQIKGEVISSTFDEKAENHVHAAEMVIEKARRMVECGKHVVILLDSITRLARAYNTMMPSSGKILSGGIEANSLQLPKRFFGSARNIEHAGSLTILGTALIETGSRMDEVIFEEFKGTGNMELHLDRELANKRIFPAISMDRSGTRKEELIYYPDEIQRIYALRRAMKGVPPVEAVEMLIQRLRKTKNNTEFLLGLNR